MTVSSHVDWLADGVLGSAAIKARTCLLLEGASPWKGGVLSPSSALQIHAFVRAPGWLVERAYNAQSLAHEVKPHVEINLK